MTRGIPLGIYALLLLGSAPLAAETRFAGYLKNFSVVQESLSNDVVNLDTSYRSQFTGRLMADGFGSHYSWQVHYELGTQFSSRQQPTITRVPGRNNYRLSDVKNTLSDTGSKTQTVQNLDRFNFQVSMNIGDLTVGRQPITFGSARIINPTDVFLPFDVQALNTEYRVGIDAVRLQMPVGQLSEWDMGYVLGASSDASAIFARFKTNAMGTDFEFTGMRLNEQKLIGAGLESTLGPFGAWLEFANVSGESSYNRVSAGLDYGFNDEVFGMLEYHYSGAGGDEVSDYPGLIDDPAYVAGGVFLAGQNYLIPSVSWQASALTSYSLQVVANLDDHSSFTLIGYERSLSDNLYLGANLYWFSGDEAELNTGGIDLGSEYGNSPNQLILNLRYYF